MDGVYLFLAWFQPHTMTLGEYEQEVMLLWAIMVTMYLEKCSYFITFSNVSGLNAARVVLRWSSFGARDRSRRDRLAAHKNWPA